MRVREQVRNRQTEMWIQNHLGPWIRYKMNGKAEFDQQKSLFFSQEIIFFGAIFPAESLSLRFGFNLD